MPKPTDLAREKLHRKFVKPERTMAELKLEILKSKFDLVKSKRARKRRRRKEARTAPRLTVVKD